MLKRWIKLLLCFSLARITAAIATVILTSNDGINMNECYLWFWYRMGYCAYIISVAAVSFGIDIALFITRYLLIVRGLNQCHFAKVTILVEGFLFTWWLIPLTLTAEWTYFAEEVELDNYNQTPRRSLVAMMALATFISLVHIIIGVSFSDYNLFQQPQRRTQG